MFFGAVKKLILPLLAILLVYGIYQYTRPTPLISPLNVISTVPKPTALDLPWPTPGQSAVGAVGYGVLSTHGPTTSVPIASVTKVITALAVLQKKPITSGQGSTIALDSTDVDFFNNYYSKDGSVIQVQLGEQLTELQALQAMLIPSANNIADSLARWAFGSVDTYKTYANQMVKNFGLTNTIVGDTNGFSDTTTSTASDLVKIGILALNNPTIAQITSQPSAQIPIAGTVNNTNFLLGSDGVIGIKTGNTDKAGGCYLFASQRTILGHSIKLVGAILGQPDLISAEKAATPLISASDQGFEQITIVHKNQIMAYYKTPWGTSARLVAPKDLSLLVWKARDIRISNNLESIKPPAKAGAALGSVEVANGLQSAKSQLVLADNLPGPPWTWRLLH